MTLVTHNNLIQPHTSTNTFFKELIGEKNVLSSHSGHKDLFFCTEVISDIMSSNTPNILNKVTKSTDFIVFVLKKSLYAYCFESADKDFVIKFIRVIMTFRQKNKTSVLFALGE